MKTPLVTAIVSTYNSEKFIEGKILDLFQQTIVDDLEIVIVNSGSQENEERIVKKYIKDHKNIKYIKTLERESIYKAWNRGIKDSTGQFITNANTDDRLRKDAFEILSKALLDNEDVGLVYADQYYTNIPNEEFNSKFEKNKVDLPKFDPLLHLEHALVLSQPMWRSYIHFKDNIWFNESFEICGDHEFHLNISRKYKLLHIPIVLGSFYKSNKNGNVSFANVEKVFLERQKATTFYIRDYLFSLQKNSKLILTLKRKFQILTSIPILLYIIIFRLHQFIRPGKYIHHIEFSYYFYSILLERTGEYYKALKICNKFLKRRFSQRIKEEQQNLIQFIGKSQEG